LQQTKQVPVAETPIQAYANPSKNKNFALADVMQAWENFKHTYQPKAGMPSLEPVFNLVQISVEGQNIIISLGNKAFEGLLNKIKPDLLLFWRKALGDENLQIQTVVSEIVEQVPAKTTLTDSQKFQLLVSKYPLLYELKEKLGLEFDFNH